MHTAYFVQLFPVTLVSLVLIDLIKEGSKFDQRRLLPIDGARNPRAGDASWDFEAAIAYEREQLPEWVMNKVQGIKDAQALRQKAAAEALASAVIGSK